MNFEHITELAAALWSNFANWGPVALPLLGVAAAGPAGGRIGRRVDSDIPRFVVNLLSGCSGALSQLREKLNSYRIPEKVSLVLNNACNLSCKHCFLQVRRLTAPALSPSEWKELAGSIVNSRVPFLSLAGKEVFLSQKNIEIIRKFDELNKGRGHFSRLGIVTNGTLITPYRPFIQQLELDYLDISLDGDANDHDSVRGEGAFAAAKENVRWAASAIPAPFFLSMTLQKQNFRRLASAMREFESLGVSNVGMAFLVPTKYTDPSLELSPEEITEVFDNLGSLGSLRLARPMKIVFEVNAHTPHGLEAFIRSPWFVPESIEADQFNNPWIEHRLANGLLLQFKLLLLPSTAHWTARITPDGLYLALGDIFDTDRYAEHALANVRDHNFEFPRIMQAARNHPRTQAIVDSYERDILPRLIHAYSDSMKNRRKLAA